VHAGVKFIPRIPAHEIVVVRALISLALTWFGLNRLGLSPRGKNRPLLFLRGAAGTGALLLYFYTLQKMPLATAVTVQYLHPILTITIASYFLKEKATAGQWLCFAASFAGVLLVRGFDARVEPFDLALGVASAFLSAIAYNLIRALRNEDHALVIMFYLPLISLVTIGPWTAFHFVPPTPWEWCVLVLIGVFTQTAQYFMTKAYQLDTAANISNLNYLGIFYASAIGYVFFDETLMLLSLAGIFVIVASAVISSHLKAR
jgi:drug/metabolite transporter (DMT)-like permease